LCIIMQAAWTGVPRAQRPRTWRLLLRYEPPNCARAAAALQRKRREYTDLAPDYYDIDIQNRSDDDLADLKQVSVDVPRTAPEVPLFQNDRMQGALRRLLYIWGVRHPASGYVQGVNDLATPFLAVFLSEHFTGPMAEWDLQDVSEAQLLTAEADSYWCLCKLVERCEPHALLCITVP
jgi:TBC1 domain family member 2